MQAWEKGKGGIRAEYTEADILDRANICFVALELRKTPEEIRKMNSEDFRDILRTINAVREASNGND